MNKITKFFRVFFKCFLFFSLHQIMVQWKINYFQRVLMQTRSYCSTSLITCLSIGIKSKQSYRIGIPFDGHFSESRYRCFLEICRLIACLSFSNNYKVATRSYFSNFKIFTVGLARDKRLKQRTTIKQCNK